jgi:RHS repeat-associated protein
MTPPASKVNLGFTGHEPDDELGLVNMKGRIYDPRLGRFLMTDPVVSNPLFSQSWNPYTYVLNNPLALVDPSGFEETRGVCEGEVCISATPDGKRLKQQSTTITTQDGKTHVLRVWVEVPPKKEETTPSDHRDTVRDDGPPSGQARIKDHPLAQQGAGFLAGVGCGLVPGCAVAHQGVVETKLIAPSDDRLARFTTGLGEMMGGAVLASGGLAGEWFGGALTVSGVGAVLGGPTYDRGLHDGGRGRRGEKNGGNGE